MDIELGNSENIASSENGQCFAKVTLMTVGFLQKIKKTAYDDPRRISHALKVGFSLTVISILYYKTHLMNGFGDLPMWAVLTIVVGMDYTIGETLCNGIMGTFAALIAALLGLCAHFIADMFDQKVETIILAFFLILIVGPAKFSRFIPEVEAKYDSSVKTFMLTFILVATSSYRVDELVQMARQRISTACIVAICLLVSLFVVPVWAGEELHKKLPLYLDELASFLEGLETESFDEKSNFESIRNSKAKEDTLCYFAKWEPCHGNFSFRHPWKHYKKVGGLVHKCAVSMNEFSSHLTTFSKTYPTFKADTELQLQIRAAFNMMSSESAKALRELSSAIQSMTIPSLAKCHVSAATLSADNLRTALSNAVIVGETIDMAMIALLLAALVDSIKEIACSVDELAELALFKTSDLVNSAVVNLVSDEETPATSS